MLSKSTITVLGAVAAASVAALAGCDQAPGSSSESALGPVPRGAILFFASGCPRGYTPFAPARGRYILAADPSAAPIAPGMTGGRENNPLVFEYIKEGVYKETGGTSSYRPELRAGNGVTQQPGTNNRLVEVRPAYIALTACQSR